MGHTQMEDNDIKNTVKNICSKIRFTKVVATRSVKGRNGDSFVGFSAGWDTVQDDYGGMGADNMPDQEEEAATVANGMTLREAKVAHYIVGMTADVAALEAAFANDGISEGFFTTQVAQVKSRYDALIRKALVKKNGGKSET